MQFSDTYITDYGHQLLGTITAGGTPVTPTSDTIIWGEARTISLQDVFDSWSVSRINALTNDNTLTWSSEGNVTKAEYTDGERLHDEDQSLDPSDSSTTTKTVMLSCNLRNSSSCSGQAYAFAVWAKASSAPDSDYKIVLFARRHKNKLVDPDDTIPTDPEYIIPSYTVEPWTAEVSFSIRLCDEVNNRLKAVIGYYASAKTVNDLTNRVVTTKSATDLANNSSNPTGDVQTIYGNKTFKDNVIISGRARQGVTGSTTSFENTDVTFNNDATVKFKGRSLANDIYIEARDGDHGVSYGYSDNVNDDYSHTRISSINNEEDCTLKVQMRLPDANKTLAGELRHYMESSNGSFSSVATNIVDGSGHYNNSVWAIGNLNSKLAGVYATTFTGDLVGNADTATTATYDTSGKVIKDTYVPLKGNATIEDKKTFSAAFPVRLKNTASQSYIDIGVTGDTSYTGTYRVTKCDSYYVKDSEKVKIVTTVSTNTSSPFALSSIETYPSETGKWTIGSNARQLKYIWASVFKGTSTATTKIRSSEESGTDLVYGYRSSNTDQGIAPSSSSSSNYINLGKSSEKFRTLYCDYIGAGTSKVSYVYSSYIGSSSYPVSNIYAAGASSYYIQIGYDSSLNTTSKMSISPSQSGYGNLGTSAKKWSAAYIHSIYVGSSATELSTYIADTQVKNATNLAYSGTSKLEATSSQLTAKTNIIPSTSGSYNLGSSSYKWKEAYFTGGNDTYYIIVDNSGTEPTIRPNKDNYCYIGTSNYMFYRGYFKTLYADSIYTSTISASSSITTPTLWVTDDSLYVNGGSLYYYIWTTIANGHNGNAGIGAMRLAVYWTSDDSLQSGGNQIDATSYKADTQNVAGTNLYWGSVRSDDRLSSFSSEDWDDDIYSRYTYVGTSNGTWRILCVAPNGTANGKNNRKVHLVLAIRIS